jgi:hydroxypyruvate reductase
MSASDDPITATETSRHREMRVIARDIFLHALSQCTIDSAFDRQISYERGILRVCEDLYDLNSFSRVFVVSIGKAAHTSAEALVTRVGAGLGITGIVCGPTDPCAQLFGFRYYRGGHPLPNAESVRAATAILRTLSTLSEDSLVVFLLSGGGSALVERPIDDEISLDDLIATYRALVHCGAPIAEINAVRKHLSAIKGGRMAQAASPAHQVSVLISDVPDNALDSLASGPTMPDSSTVEQCMRIVDQYDLRPRFPASVRELFDRRALEETPKQGDSAFARSRWWTVLSNTSLQRAAVEKAAMSGMAVQIDNTCDDWDYKDAADYLLRRARELRKGVSRVCLISGGEVTVKVEGEAGVGGRNQQFALYCAEKIAGEGITVLSAGSDGIDGNSPAAGAIVDGTTVSRAATLGLDTTKALATFDALPVFQALGDDITIGPSGNNIRDLRIIIAD